MEGRVRRGPRHVRVVYFDFRETYRDAYRQYPRQNRQFASTPHPTRVGLLGLGELATGKENRPPRGMASAANNATPGRRKKTGQQYFDVGKVGRYAKRR